MKYTAKGTNNRHFELLNDKQELVGKLDYTSWLSHRKAELHVGDKAYEVKPTNMMQTTIAIHDGETTLYTLNFNWKGQIVIQKEGGQAYTFRRVGFFNAHYGLFTEQEREIVILNQHYELSKWSFSYDMETDDNYAEGKDTMMLLAVLYSINMMHMSYAPAVV